MNDAPRGPERAEGPRSQGPQRPDLGPSALAPVDSAALLAQRYGPAPDPQRRRRITWTIAAALAVFTLVFGTWVAVHQLRPGVTTQEVGFVVHDEQTIEVIFDITMPIGARAQCTLEALDARFGQVGLLDTEVGPMPDRVNRVSIELTTSAPPVTGIVRSCELAD